MRFDAAIQAVARAGMSPDQRRMPLDSVFDGVSPAARSMLYRHFQPNEPIDSLFHYPDDLDTLCSAISPAQSDELALCLQSYVSPPVPQTAFPDSREAVHAWANTQGVAHALVFSAIELAPQAGWLYSGRAVSMADVFDPSFSAATGRSSHVRPNAVRAQLWQWLEGYARSIAHFRDHPVPPLVVDAPYRAFVARLEAWRAPVLASFPRGDWPARIALDSDGVRVELAQSEVHDGHLVRPSVFLPYEDHQQPHCSCHRTHCWHGSAAVDAFGLWLLEEHGYFLDQLKRHLRPAYEKVFDALAAAPPVKEVVPLTQVGFRIDLDKVANGEAYRAFDVMVASARGKSKTIKVRDALAGGSLLSAKDRRTLERIAEMQRDRSVPGTLAETMRGLVGHPHVSVREHRRELPIEVRIAPVQIEVVERPGGVEARVRLNGAPTGTHFGSAWLSGVDGILAFEPDLEHGVLWLGELPASAWAFVTAVRKFGGFFPTQVGPRLMKSLEALGPVALALPPSLQGANVPCDERLRVRIVPGHGLSLTLSLTVEPLPGELPRLPGEGPAALSSWRTEGRVFTTRDLQAEKDRAAKLLQHLGLPAHTDESAAVWDIDEPDQVLTLIEQLQQLGDQIVIQTVGDALRVSRPMATADLHLTVKKKTDWFALEGVARIDSAVVPIARVIDAIRGGNRWVDLGNHQFARLSEQLIERLAPVALSSRARADANEVTLADAPGIEALSLHVDDLKLADDFGRIVTRMRESESLKVRLPRGFKGTLRDYQLDGFTWLSRLAAWGAGAVLADDMGLGKTVQTLALLVSRAKQGPALVVAPTSVAPNWKAEAARFAPALKVTLVRDVDREKAIAAAGPNDVLVISWGLLVQEQDSLSCKKFATVVLDEAHAMKNANTQRAQAARALTADFVVALSGTPIENRLGELWSLFRAVLPGLFGSHDAFRERFVMPIERDDDPTAKAALKARVQPFLLRRTKDAVAKELPARTDIRLEVPLSEVELGVYEAARREAVEQLDGLTEKGANEARFHVLAALTRLRQLSCHVGLVDPSWVGSSAKIDRLNGLIAELKESGHKVLVFSQFTTLLDRVEQSMDPSVRWLRLDGSTSDRERQKRVAAFQEGAADVFLLSLKAGGTGLNLTAADYVVHLDPWWNPAVEDQASDRAHRLGQRRPVTVYRLVSKGTVEERILALHASKRALVSSVLDGTHTAGGLTTKQLMALVTG